MPCSPLYPLRACGGRDETSTRTLAVACGRTVTAGTTSTGSSIDRTGGSERSPHQEERGKRPSSIYVPVVLLTTGTGTSPCLSNMDLSKPASLRHRMASKGVVDRSGKRSTNKTEEAQLFSSKDF